MTPRDLSWPEPILDLASLSQAAPLLEDIERRLQLAWAQGAMFELEAAFAQCPAAACLQWHWMIGSSKVRMGLMLQSPRREASLASVIEAFRVIAHHDPFERFRERPTPQHAELAKAFAIEGADAAASLQAWEDVRHAFESPLKRLAEKAPGLLWPIQERCEIDDGPCSLERPAIVSAPGIARALGLDDLGAHIERQLLAQQSGQAPSAPPARL